MTSLTKSVPPATNRHRLPIPALVVTAVMIYLVGGVRAEGISVSQSLDRSQIPFEDSVHFDLTLQWAGSQTAYLFEGPLSPVLGQLKVQGFTSSISSSGPVGNETTTKRFRYTLVPTSSGQARIESVRIGYVSWPDSIPGELVTEAMTVQVAQPLPPDREESSAGVWLIITGLAVVTLVVVAIVAVRRRRPKEIIKSPQEQFLESLDELKTDAAGDFRKFQTGLYDSLSVFLTARYDIIVDRLGDDEIIAALDATGLNNGQKQQLGTWLVQARQDKFRPVAGNPADIVRLETEIRGYFENL
ncbi:MAG: BatD family protein [bacterium]